MFSFIRYAISVNILVNIFKYVLCNLSHSDLFFLSCAYMLNILLQTVLMSLPVTQRHSQSRIVIPHLCTQKGWSIIYLRSLLENYFITLFYHS